MSHYDYVAVGHVTCDVLSDGDAEVRQPGGTAFYSALQAARLGLSSLIVTQGVPSQIEELLAPYSAEIELRVFAAAQTTTLATIGSGANRTQRLLSWAGPMTEPAVDARILHLAPVARETPRSWRGSIDFIGLTPQGLVRGWRGEEIHPVELEPQLLPESIDAAVVSEHEQSYCGALFAAPRAHAARIAITAGAAPATVHVYGDGERRASMTAVPPRVTVRDDLGAGDVFAAAFFVASAEGADPLVATRFANAAASTRIAGLGPSAIATRAQLEASCH